MHAVLPMILSVSCITMRCDYENVGKPGYDEATQIPQLHGPYTIVHSLALHTFQVGFLRSIACPCSELLHKVLPQVEKLLRNAQ